MTLFYLTLPVLLVVIFSVLIVLWLWAVLVSTFFWLRLKLTGTPPPRMQWPSPDEPNGP